MSYLELSGAPVISGQVALPLRGRLVADVLIAAGAAPERGARVEATFQGGRTYRCTVERSGPQGGFHALRVVGGTGGLSSVIDARYYESFPAANIARDIAEDCGETVGEIDLPGTLPRWTRPAGAAHEALGALMARYPERSWRIQPDGSLWIGVEKWPDHPRPLQVESEDSSQGTFVTQADASLTPGVRLTMTRGSEEISKRVTRVVQVIGTQLRSEVATGDGQDQGPGGLGRVIRQVMVHVDYLGLYPCRILRDHGDHHLDLQPDHPQLPKLTRIPLVPPIPGAQIKVKAGGSALVMFQHGDPSRPLVLHIIGTLEYLNIVTGKGQHLTLDDDRGHTSDDKVYAKPSVVIEDMAGQTLDFQARPGAETVTLRDRAGQELYFNAVPKTVTLRGITHLSLAAALVALADGGPAVARVGDAVRVTGVTPGSGIALGTVTMGSDRVTSG